MRASHCYFQGLRLRTCQSNTQMGGVWGKLPSPTPPPCRLVPIDVSVGKRFVAPGLLVRLAIPIGADACGMAYLPQDSIVPGITANEG